MDRDEGMASEVERLAEVLNARYAVYRPDTETVARAILASDWLAAHDAEVAARAWNEGWKARACGEFWQSNPYRADALAASQGAGESGEGER